MAPLKSLEQLHPIIDTTFQSFCASHGIFTVEDFLIHDLYVLAAFAEQQPESEKLKQGITQILSVINAERQSWMNGLELLEDARENKHVLSTGFEGVDTLLGGGLREGQLTEIVGPSSSGKTQVCLRAASNVATNYNAKVFYLDTGNSFSPQRISGFVNWKSGPSIARVVNVESLVRGFLINVYLEKNSPGLLVRILQAFEKLGLEVLDANVSCSDCFQLQAVGEENEDTKIVKPQVVKRAVKQAIKEWSESNGQT